MMHRITTAKLKLRYDQLDHLEWWDGYAPHDDQSLHESPMLEGYTRVIATADWDEGTHLLKPIKHCFTQPNYVQDNLQ